MALAGGVGGAKLVFGLAQILSDEQLVIIGNVADDFELYGLHISPDLDTVMYTLAGVANPETGWGLSGDSWQMLDMLARYGEDTWFRLGDKDVATHLLRTHWLNQGLSLTEVTARLASGLGVRHRLLPATDDPVATMVETVEGGTLGFQDYFVRHQWQPTVRKIWFRGIEQTCVTDDVKKALDEADVIIFCPSNPILSIEPILSVPGVREALRTRKGVCVAVSPFIGNRAVKGPAAKLMPELGLEVSPRGVSRYYEGLLDGLVIDSSDAERGQEVEIPFLATETLMVSNQDKVRLAEEILDWSGSF